ncbi:MAG TPA: hypothetical protein VIE65_12935 [Methylobacter sp.]|jgi:hypothetical protein
MTFTTKQFITSTGAFIALSLLFSSANAGMPIRDGENVIQAAFDATGLAVAKELRLTDSNVLLTDSDPMKAKLAACQPQKGEQVKALAFQANAGGIRGANVARVAVLEGRCKGVEGWVGTARLEKIQ